MKVKDLIKKLSEQNQDLEVVIGEDEWLEIESVKEETYGIQKPVIVIA